MSYSLRARSAACLAFFAVLITPCWWHQSIYAGDLGSHIYNAWLATLIERGQAPGLTLVPKFTNVAFDVLLESLYRRLGSELAQKLAVSLVVIVFAAGLLALLWSTRSRFPWFALPSVAMLSYGWVFHMGFFNFLLSLGLALAALAILLRLSGPRAWTLSAAFGAAAMLAHPYPLVWAAGVAFYSLLAKRTRPRNTLWLCASTLAAIVLLSVILNQMLVCRWSARQIVEATGAEQFWIAGLQTFWFVPAALFGWGLLFLHRTSRIGTLRIVLSYRFQLVAIAVFAVGVLPTAISPSSGSLGLSFIAERSSLFVAVLSLFALAGGRSSTSALVWNTVLALAFFGAMYHRGSQLEQVENNLAACVRTLPPHSLITAPLFESSRTNQWGHMIDRVCVEHCFSYANYEAPVGSFRVRLSGYSPVAARDFAHSAQLQEGIYYPRQGEPSFYVIGECGEGHFCATWRSAPATEQSAVPGKSSQNSTAPAPRTNN